LSGAHGAERMKLRAGSKEQGMEKDTRFVLCTVLSALSENTNQLKGQNEFDRIKI